MDTVIHVDGKKRVIDKVSAGGAVTFASLSIKIINPEMRVGVGSKIGCDIPDFLLTPFENHGISLRYFIRDKENPTTRFELVYSNFTRSLSCPSRCSNLDPCQYHPELFNSKVFHLGPLCREIDAYFVDTLGERLPRGSMVGIDLQGFIRLIKPDGSIGFISSKEAYSTVSHIHEVFGNSLVIKGDDKEVSSISQLDDPKETMSYFLDEFPKATILITFGRKGSMLGKKVGNSTKITKIPSFKPEKIIDETGAGDVFLASFLYDLMRHGSSPMQFKNYKAAALFASASSSFLVEHKGYMGVRPENEINARVRSQVYFYK